MPPKIKRLVCKYAGEEVSPLWSVESDVATITTEGILTFNDYGKAVVTATYNDMSSSVIVQYTKETDFTSQMEINKAYKTDYSIGEKFTYTLVDSSQVSNWRTIIINMKEYNGVRLTGRGGNAPRLYCYIDSNDFVLEVAEQQRVAKNESFPKSQNAVKVIISFHPEMEEHQVIAY